MSIKIDVKTSKIPYCPIHEQWPRRWQFCQCLEVLPSGLPAQPFSLPGSRSFQNLILKVNFPPWWDLPQVQLPLEPDPGRQDQKQPGCKHENPAQFQREIYHLDCLSRLSESKALDMTVGWDSLRLHSTFHLLDLHCLVFLSLKMNNEKKCD